MKLKLSTGTLLKGFNVISPSVICVFISGELHRLFMFCQVRDVADWVHNGEMSEWNNAQICDRNKKKKPIWKRAGFYFQLRAGLFCLYHDHIPDRSLYFGLNGNRVLALHLKHKFTAPLSGCSGNLVTAKVSSDVSIVMHRDLQSWWGPDMWK